MATGRALNSRNHRADADDALGRHVIAVGDHSLPILPGRIAVVHDPGVKRHRPSPADVLAT